MALKQQLATKLSQKLVMTPSLQQAIKMLQMNRLEIETLIRAELEKNVVLEVEGEGSSAEDNRVPSEAEVAVQNDIEREHPQSEENSYEKIDVEAFFADYMDSAPIHSRNSYESIDDETSFEQMLSGQVSLADHLLWQLEMSTGDSLLKDIGEAIIGNLNKSGYLRATIDEICSMDTRFTEAKVQDALKMIQEFDPAGVGASSLKECLLIQLDALEIDDPVCRCIIENHLTNLEKQDYDAILKDIGISLDELKVKLDVIRRLDPHPGLKFNNERVIYIEPEVYVTKENGEYKIRLNDDGLPKLRINPYYKKLANYKELGDKDAVEYIQDKMKAAVWLLKSFDQRQKTIYKVAQSIITRQRDFFDYGENHLKPMVLSDVALDISMHESTVSRVVNNKYMHTPNGVYELKYFFQRGLSSSSGDDVSSLIVKKKIEQLIENEKRNKPLSDSRIAEILADDGIQIARRTVAKYREELNIPSSSVRRKKI